MRKIKDAKYRNVKKERLQERQGIETQMRKGVRLLRNRKADDESSKVLYTRLVMNRKANAERYRADRKDIRRQRIA
jgi:hypothetical protein